MNRKPTPTSCFSHFEYRISAITYLISRTNTYPIYKNEKQREAETITEASAQPAIYTTTSYKTGPSDIRGGADKSLARPGRKQATTTKLSIYSAYSPRSSIHFLAHCSNFYKPLTKKFRRLSVQPGLRGSTDLRVGKKLPTFNRFFSPGNRW